MYFTMPVPTGFAPQFSNPSGIIVPFVYNLIFPLKLSRTYKPVNGWDLLSSKPSRLCDGLIRMPSN